ncbi:lysosomal acid phosphatase-like [Hermetia illucens]|nr:lysosomal acid phosphatase-like [Hermetia illucens]
MYLVKLISRGILLCSVLFAGCSKCISATSSLMAVSMLTRHGDRAPERGYPLDPYAEYEWLGGYGALSPKGVRELYLSGLIKSQRYASLLSPTCLIGPCTFDLNKIYVQSSSVPRCIASATSFLEAFLPIQWPQELIVVPPASEDEILAFGKPCPNYDSVMRMGPDLNSPEFKEVIDFESEEGQHLLDYLRERTGLNLTTSMEMLLLLDTISVQLDNGFELPQWAESVYDQYLTPLSNVAIKIWGDSEYIKIRSGALLKNIIDRLDNFTNGISEQNIVFYSAHDMNILGLLYLLDMKHIITGSPAYGAVFAMELHENGEVDDDLEVKIVYYTHYGDENPIEVSIPNCEAPCPFKTFKDSVESKLTLNYEQACLE